MLTDARIVLAVLWLRQRLFPTSIPSFPIERLWGEDRDLAAARHEGGHQSRHSRR
jgi:hypothetical protein